MNLQKILQANNISKLLLNKNKLLNEKLKKNSKKISIKCIGGYTISELVDWIKIFSYADNIKCHISDNQWGSAFSILNSFKKNEQDKDLIIIFNSWRDLFSSNNLNKLVINPNEIIQIFKNFIKKQSNNKSKTIILAFDQPEIDIVINKDSIKNVINYLNYELVNLTKNSSICEFVDEQKNILSKKIEWHSQRDWYSFGKPITSEAFVFLAEKISRIIKFTFFSTKKVLALDLDNTLWGGIIGDDGPKNIKIGDETAEGRIFSEIQSYFKMIKERGILLTIVSKNEKKLALEGFKNKKNFLKLSDFVSMRINWKNKSENILSIAKELNLGLDSFVFIDDNPSEREEVRKRLLNVSVPELGSNPENYIKIINSYDYFNINSKISEEDKKRTVFYQTDLIRKKIEKKSISDNNFLKSLKIEIRYLKFNNNLERVHQLTNKTNQFNLTTQRLDINEISKFGKNKNNKIIVVEAKDKFGEYGIISIMYLSVKSNYFEIINWLMSCRVFNKTIEQAIINSVIKLMLKSKKLDLITSYIPTKKNHLLLDILKKLGFEKDKEYSNRTSDWKLKYKKVKQHACLVKNEI